MAKPRFDRGLVEERIRLEGSAGKLDAQEPVVLARARRRLEQVFEAAGSQAAIAEAIGVSEGSLTGWKTGTKPGLDKLWRLSQASGVSLDWIVGRDVPQRWKDRIPCRSLKPELHATVVGELAEQGASPFALSRYMPTADAMVEGAVQWARTEIRTARRAARQRYRKEIEVFSRGIGPYRDLPGEAETGMSDHIAALGREYAIAFRSLALAIVRAAAKPATELPPLLQFGPHVYDLYAFLVQLPDDARCEFVLVSELSPELEASMDADVLRTDENPWPEDVERAKTAGAFADWCAAQHWTQSPDPHYEGDSRWRWDGPLTEAPEAAR